MPARDKTEASVDVACVTRGMPDLQRLDDSYFAFVSTEKLYPRSVARGSNEIVRPPNEFACDDVYRAPSRGFTDCLYKFISFR